MALVVLVGVGAILFWMFDEVEEAPSPAERGAVEQVLNPSADGGEGSVETPEEQKPEEVEPDVVVPTVDN
ncbi:hypothetical protein DEA8626_04077 [Defluviimonas aquaemixtae]|uniref:Uncharacterized protein n=2 Tax=Albidovulum aquaemixtae TaxID=1542388 RepID=A0A2R8BNL5_9RHOB|nr:hypothetical protein DEA8626_04077 [Defluviimonas aquaemixtae]